MSSDPRRSSPRARLTGWIRGRRDRGGRTEPRRLYAGHRGPRTAVYVVTREGLAPLPPSRPRGAAYDWGADTAGALALAYALLADLTGRRAHAGVAAALAAGPIAALPRNGFVLDARELRYWLSRARPVTPNVWESLRPEYLLLWPPVELPARHDRRKP